MSELDYLHEFFPNLHRVRLASDPDVKYNCIAWAAGDNTRQWEPYLGHWPDGVKKDYSLQSCIDVFEQLGYEICEDSALEEGFEKVVIWSKGNEYEHVAKQLKNGKWISKVGDLEDIVHDLDDLTSSHPEGYGNIACYMKRVFNKPKRRNRSSGSST